MLLFGPPDVKKLEARQDIRGLIQMLKYRLDRPDREKYDRLRQSACDALARIGLPAVEPLIAELLLGGGKENPPITGALRAVGSPAVPRLIAAMRMSLGKNAYLADRIGQILGQIQDERAVEPLIEVMLNTPFDSKSFACQALRAFGEKAVAPLKQRLPDAGPYGQVKIVQALGEVGLPALDALLKIFIEYEGDVRLWAAHGLGKLGTPAHEALLSAYRCAPLEIRRAFAKHILLLQRPPALIAAFQTDHDARVRLSYDNPLPPPVDSEQIAAWLAEEEEKRRWRARPKEVD